MKKKITTVILLVLAVLLVAALVACNPTRGNGPNSDELEDPETGLYTVTFNANGGTTAEDVNLTNVPRGSTVPYPTYVVESTGQTERYTPTKRGYDFVYWEWTDNTGTTREFYFADDTSHTPDVVTKSITIRALYKAQEFTHTPVPTAGLVWEEKDGTIVYSIDDNFYKENEVVLGDEDVKFTSKYDAQTDFACPWVADADGNVVDSNKFCFWYYMTDKVNEDDLPVYKTADGGETTSEAEAVKGEDGKPVRAQVPVQLTKWKEDDKNTVQSLDKYPLVTALTIYPMFENNLPKVTVTFDDMEETITKRPVDLLGEEEVADITEGFKAKLDAQHSFVHWYYQLSSKDDEGNTVYTDHEFTFAPAPAEDDNADASADDLKGTDLREATGNKGPFVPVTLALHAKTVRLITINTAGDLANFATQIKQMIEDEADILERRKDKGYEDADGQDQEKLDLLEEYLTAKISIISSHLTAVGDIGPIFDSAHPFRGTIDGELTGGDYAKLSYVKTVSVDVPDESANITVDASVFGYVAGEVKNLKVEASITVAASKAKEGNKVVVTYYLAPLASFNTGKMSNIDVKINEFTISGESNITRNMIFGGVVAVNIGSVDDDDKGRIEKCNVTVENLTLSGVTDITFGGIAGRSEASTRIAECTADIAVGKIEDATSTSTIPVINFGGISGSNGGTIERSSATFDVEGADVTLNGATLKFGGITGGSTNGIIRSHATIGKAKGEGTDAVVLTVKVVGGNAKIGGIVGANEGYIADVYSEAYITVQASEEGKAVEIYLAGIAGDNSGRGNSNTNPTETSVCSVSYSYSRGSLLIDINEARSNVTAYVGGISGEQRKARLINNFTAMAIEVTCAEAVESKINLGYLFGKVMEEIEEKLLNHLYYIDDSDDGAGLTLNGKTYKITTEDKDGESVSTPNFGTMYGEHIKSADLTIEFLTDNDKLNFDGRESSGTATWDIPEEGEAPVYPTLK